MNNRKKLLIIGILISINTVISLFALAYYSETIEGISPLQIGSTIPKTFIQTEVTTKLSDNNQVIDLSNIGIGGYDIYKMSINVTNPYTNLPKTELDESTENWVNWSYNKDEIANSGIDNTDKEVGNSSLWFDVFPSTAYNTWVSYGNWSLNLDLSNHNALVIYVKSNVTLQWIHALGGGTSIMFGTGNWDTHAYYIYDLNITTNWQQLVIPFIDFTSVGKPDLHHIDWVMLSVDPSPGNPSSRIWMDGLSFTNVEDSYVYCNGRMTETSKTGITEIEDVWDWSNIYGYNQKAMFNNKIVLEETGPADPVITLFLRLYPNAYTHYGYSNLNNLTGVIVDRYTWGNISRLNECYNSTLVFSVEDQTYRGYFNGIYIPLNENKSTVYLYPAQYALKNTISTPISINQAQSNYSLVLYSKSPFLLADFSFMDRALLMLQRFKGINYPIVFFYILVSTVEVLAIVFYKGKVTNKMGKNRLHSVSGLD